MKVYLYVMDKRLKKGLIIVLILLILLVVVTIIANSIIKNKLKESLNHISETVHIQYDDIQVSVLKGSVKLLHPKILVYGKTTGNVNLEVDLNTLAINNLSYWNYLFNDKFAIKNISILEPKVIYHHNEMADFSATKCYNEASFDETIEIGAIQIMNAQLEIFNIANESTILKVEDFNLKVEAITANSEIFKRKVPVLFKDYQVEFKNMFYAMNAFENLMIEQAYLDAHLYKIENLAIKTKYSPEDLSNQISMERDHFNLAIDSLLVKNHEFGIRNDSIFYFDSKQVDVFQPNFKIYRDKLVEDDPAYKPLYSKSLRNLNFNLLLENVNLHDAAIIYTEKVREETTGGILQFSNLKAKIENLGNVLANEDITAASIEGVFMENTPIKVDWNFNVKDLNDEFIFKAEIGKLNASHMNQFMEPNLNIRLNGEVEQTYFTINGNDHKSRIDLKLNYENFDVVVLKQDGKGKNKFLSAVVNLFVSKDSNKQENDFRHGNAAEVERDNTKSVFNYLWLNIKDGLLNAMTGDGKKN